jgi:FlaA1/EpsC-like NDP-sugar epimerase
MGEPVKIVQLARDLIKLSGLTEDDVPIVFTGLRTGEKLEEELFEAGMQTEATSHPEILRVVGRDTSIATDLDTLIRHLEDAAGCGDRRAIEDLLARSVQGFAQHDIPSTNKPH